MLTFFELLRWQRQSRLVMVRAAKSLRYTSGVFLMALKFVIEHAILLQSENELTI